MSFRIKPKTSNLPNVLYEVPPPSNLRSEILYEVKPPSKLIKKVVEIIHTPKNQHDVPSSSPIHGPSVVHILHDNKPLDNLNYDKVSQTTSETISISMHSGDAHETVNKINHSDSFKTMQTIDSFDNIRDLNSTAMSGVVNVLPFRKKTPLFSKVPLINRTLSRKAINRANDSHSNKLYVVNEYQLCNCTNFKAFAFCSELLGCPLYLWLIFLIPFILGALATLIFFMTVSPVFDSKMVIQRQNNETNYFNSNSEYYEYLYLNADPCQNYSTTTTTTATTMCICRGRRCRNCNTTTTTTFPLALCNSTTTKYITMVKLNKTQNSFFYSCSIKVISMHSTFSLALVLNFIIKEVTTS